MTDADLAEAFGGGGVGGDMTAADPLAEDMAGDEEAIDLAIDEALAGQGDPAMRREAFKNAVRLIAGL